MTFEDTDTLAPSRDTTEGDRPARRLGRVTPPHETDLSKMMGFVGNTEMIAGHIRGLATLFKGSFIETPTCLPDDQAYAADIVEECLRSIAKRLDDNAELARQSYNHMVRGAAR